MNSTEHLDEDDLDYHVPLMPPLAKYIISGLIFLAGAGGMGVLAALKTNPKDKENISLIPLVEVYQAINFDEELEIRITGRVVPFRETQVAAQVSGIVETKSPCCETGTFVTQNDVLVIINQSDLNLEKQRLLAELQQSKDMLKELDAERKGAELDIKLAEEEVQLLTEEKLRKTNLRGSVSQTTLDLAERNLINARKILQTLKNNYSLMATRESRLNSGIKLAETSLEKTKLDIERATIKAPIDGVIVSDPVEEGSFISVGGIIATINDRSKVEVECNLRQDQLEWLLDNSGTDMSRMEDAYELPRTPVEITTSDGPMGGVWIGELSRFDGLGLDEMTKTIPVRIDVIEPVVQVGEEPNRRFRALVQNMYVRVKIKINVKETQKEKTFLTFPATAIQPGDYVWVVQGDTLKKVDVKIVDQREKNEKAGLPEMVVVLVDEGLAAGDKVVVSPISQPIDGITKVREQTAS